MPPPPPPFVFRPTNTNFKWQPSENEKHFFFFFFFAQRRKSVRPRRLKFSFVLNWFLFFLPPTSLNKKMSLNFFFLFGEPLVQSLKRSLMAFRSMIRPFHVLPRAGNERAIFSSFLKIIFVILHEWSRTHECRGVKTS